MAELNIPSLGEQFNPQPHRQVQEEKPTLSLDAVKALADPKGYMENYQLGQISKQVAQMKTDKIRPELQGMALKSITNFQDKNKELYDKNTGFGKFNLTAQQNLELAGHARNAENEINTLNQWTGEYQKLLDDSYKEVAKGTLDAKEVQDWDDSMIKGMRDAKTPGDLPHLQMEYAKRIHPKVKAEDLIKTEKEYDAKITQTEKYKNRTKPLTPKETEEDIKTEYPLGSAEWGAYRKIKEGLGIVDPKDSDEVAISKIAKPISSHVKFSREQQPANVTINQGTPENGGMAYNPLPEYQGVKTWKIGGEEKVGKIGPLHPDGSVDFIPQKKELKAKAAQDIETAQGAIDDPKTKDSDKKRYKASIDNIKKSPDSYAVTYDTEHPEHYHVDDVIGGRDAYTKQTNKGGQKINIPPKPAGKSYTIKGKPYTESELKSAGWSEEQLKQLK